MVAASCGHTHVIKVLVANGANVDATRHTISTVPTATVIDLRIHFFAGMLYCVVVCLQSWTQGCSEGAAGKWSHTECTYLREKEYFELVGISKRTRGKKVVVMLQWYFLDELIIIITVWEPAAYRSKTWAHRHFKHVARLRHRRIYTFTAGKAKVVWKIYFSIGVFFYMRSMLHCRGCFRLSFWRVKATTCQWWSCWLTEEPASTTAPPMLVKQYS